MDAAGGTALGIMLFFWMTNCALTHLPHRILRVLNFAWLSIAIGFASAAPHPIDFYYGVFVFVLDATCLGVSMVLSGKLDTESFAKYERRIENEIFDKRPPVMPVQKIVQLTVNTQIIFSLAATFGIYEVVPRGLASVASFAAALTLCVTYVAWNNVNARSDVVTTRDAAGTLRVRFPPLFVAVTYTSQSVCVGIFMFGHACAWYLVVVALLPFVLAHVTRPSMWWALRAFAEMQFFCWLAYFQGWPAPARSQSETQSTVSAALALASCVFCGFFAVHTVCTLPHFAPTRLRPDEV